MQNSKTATYLVISYQRVFYQFLIKLYYQGNKVSSFTTSYNERLEKMRANNKVSTNIEIAKPELEATINTRLDEFKSETVNSIEMKLSALS